MITKLFLRFTGLLFALYGGYLYLDPQYLIDLLELGDGTAARVELRAMYGGLQTGFGLFCLLAALKSDYYRAGLVLLVLCITPLALGRLYSVVSGDEGHGGYTWGAMAFEFAVAALAAVALASSSRSQAA